MIRIDYGTDDRHGIVFRWSCSECNVDDQAIQPGEGVDSVVWHLRKYHDREELVQLGTILTQGMAAAAKAVHLPDPEYDAQVDLIAESVTAYIINGAEAVAV